MRLLLSVVLAALLAVTMPLALTGAALFMTALANLVVGVALPSIRATRASGTASPKVWTKSPGSSPTTCAIIIVSRA